MATSEDVAQLSCRTQLQQQNKAAVDMVWICACSAGRLRLCSQPSVSVANGLHLQLVLPEPECLDPTLACTGTAQYRTLAQLRHGTLCLARSCAVTMSSGSTCTGGTHQPSATRDRSMAVPCRSCLRWISKRCATYHTSCSPVTYGFVSLEYKTTPRPLAPAEAELAGEQATSTPTQQQQHAQPGGQPPGRPGGWQGRWAEQQARTCGAEGDATPPQQAERR